MILFHRWLSKYRIHWQFMTIHELWNSIISLNFKASLVIAPPPVRYYDVLRTKIDMWLTPNRSFTIIIWKVEIVIITRDHWTIAAQWHDSREIWRVFIITLLQLITLFSLTLPISLTSMHHYSIVATLASSNS